MRKVVGVRVGALQAMQEEKVTKKRGITEEDKEEFSHMTETDGLGRYGQMRKRLLGLLF
jgi:hypothetical protein